MPATLLKAIEKAANPAKRPDGESYLRLSLAQTKTIADRLETSQKQVEISALEAAIVPERYVRNMNAFSCNQQAALLKARVVIVGLGGLGGGVCEILARVGVGALTLIDGDSFEESNLNRQFLSTVDSLGQSKAAVAGQRVVMINPTVEISTCPVFLNVDNATELIARAAVAVDCLDNLKTRFTLAKAARSLDVPLVSAAVAGASGHVTTIYPNDPGLEQIYGPEDQAPLKGAETTLGCLPQAVTLLSSLECSEVIKIILKQGSLLRQKMLMVDLADNTMEVLKL
jgi:molybdopterin-synthase adenylyltransferase